MLIDIPSTRTKYQEWGINIPTKDSHFIIKAIQVIPTMLQGRWQACRVIFTVMVDYSRFISTITKQIQIVGQRKLQKF